MNPEILAAMFHHKVALFAESRAASIPAMLRGASALLASVKLDIMAGNQAPDEDTFWTDPAFGMRPYNVQNGTLMIPVAGLLLSQCSYQVGSYATGYQYIDRAFSRGMADDDVERIALLVNSPGGFVSECFDVADAMFAARGSKPVRAIVSDDSYSAAYALSSTADEIYVSRTGGVGSIGVVTGHVDYSKALEDMGIKVTLISAPKGGHKVDGNPYEPLPKDVEARIQDEIDETYEMFVASVARNRNMSEGDVRGTKALTYSARQGVKVGLADQVSTAKAAVLSFTATRSEGKKAIGAVKMADIKKEDHDAAVSAATNTGASAERARISAIINSPEGKKRPNAANAVAFDTAMTVEQASTFLAKLPEEKTEAVVAVVAPAAAAAVGAGGPTAFVRAMDASQHPNLQAAAGSGGDAGPSAAGTRASFEESANAILSDFAAAGGMGLRPKAKH